ncbi:MAG: hypothetical protein MK110_12265 [Fuerstiella sp.]|nr:hypothetical protein [Fuerstiella sp.]
MNAVGKMLIVLQLCLSLLFVCFAGAAYSLQDTWREKFNAANTQVTSLQGNLNDEVNQRKTEVLAANQLREEAESSRDTAEEQLRSARTTTETAERLLADERQARNKAIAESERAAAESDARLAETLAHRQEIEARGVRLTRQLADIREKDSQILELNKSLNVYRQAEERYLAENVRMKELLRANGIDSTQRVAVKSSEPIEKVDGYVVDKLQSRSRTQEFVKINIGSDDTIREGMTVHVFRQDQFVCDVRVSLVEPDSSVGIVVASSRRYNVQEGDRVTTKL